MPISCTDVATVVGLHTATIDDDAEDDESCTRRNLDHTQDELDLSISANAEELDDAQDGQKYSDPDLYLVSPDQTS
jgi:hypothetical protein